MFDGGEACGDGVVGVTPLLVIFGDENAPDVVCVFDHEVKV